MNQNVFLTDLYETPLSANDIGVSTGVRLQIFLRDLLYYLTVNCK